MAKNNDSSFFKDWTTKKLKEYFMSLDELIYGEHSCYGTRDLRMYDGVQIELHNRGVSISSKVVFN